MVDPWFQMRLKYGSQLVKELSVSVFRSTDFIRLVMLLKL